MVRALALTNKVRPYHISKRPRGGRLLAASCTQAERTTGVRQFFKNKSVFITGATGLLGKVIVEKLLRVQPDLRHVYLLIQPGKAQEPDSRLAEALDQPLFQQLRAIHQDNFDNFMRAKVSALPGNLAQPAAGLTEEHLQLVQREVHVVLHCAASTAFDERLDVAFRLNSQGAEEVAKVAAGCSQLAAHVHVSTAFVNGMRQGLVAERPLRLGDCIAEELGLPEAAPLDVEEERLVALTSAQHIRSELATSAGICGKDLEAQVERRMQELGARRAQKRGWQNVYVYTKAMGEMLAGAVAAEAGLPMAVVRPSIVESAEREPLPGWVEGLRMADPLIAAYGKGRLDGFVMPRNGILDLIPVDHVASAVLAAAHRASIDGGLAVYQVASSASNPLPNTLLAEAVHEHFQATPLHDRQRRPIPVPPPVLYPDAASFLSALEARLLSTASPPESSSTPAASPTRAPPRSNMTPSPPPSKATHSAALLQQEAAAPTVSAHSDPASSSEPEASSGLGPARATKPSVSPTAHPHLEPGQPAPGLPSSQPTHTLAPAAAPSSPSPFPPTPSTKPDTTSGATPAQGSRRRQQVAQALLQQLQQLADLYTPFTTWPCRFDTTNTQQLLASLSNEEQELLAFDAAAIDWRTYLRDVHVPGLRKYVLREEN